MRANIFVIIMILFSINAFLYVGGVRVVETDSRNFIGNFIDTDSYEQGNLEFNDSFEDSVPTSFSESGANEVLSFIDVLGAVRDFILFLVNIIFTPIGLFTGSGLPQVVGLIFGAPLLIGGVIAIIYFIRSGS